VLSGTWPNRDYLYAATSDGVTATNFPCDTTADGCIPHVDTIFDAMTKAGVTWGAFTDSAPLSLALYWPTTHEGVHTMQDLYDQLANGTLPNVAFVDGMLGDVLFPNGEDDHPTTDLQNGERWSKKIYDAAVASPLWDKLVIFFTYDEAGGFSDHVPPPPYDADKTKVCIARNDSGSTAHPDTEFFELGIRVPLIAISPWARRGFVSHVQHEHTSITRFIELLFDIPALTARDANSDALLDMFDFGCMNEDPLPKAPDPGTGGCVRTPPNAGDAGKTDGGP
jgi:phospholipase C